MSASSAAIWRRRAGYLDAPKAVGEAAYVPGGEHKCARICAPSGYPLAF